ncbi:putative quinol monooxygenase [Streptomyces sp. NPDC059385]|uniref:putative quinol monooxygenase n=1 Tax=Streptomyces sp. NPDC059385 TaxID=3346817 RepID=UPI0036C671E1
MVNVGLFVRIEARPGHEKEVQAAITAALTDVEQEPGTTVWLALRLGPTTFAVVDAFPDQEARQEHLEAGRARLARLPELLAQPPTIEYTDILAAKIPGTTAG